MKQPAKKPSPNRAPAKASTDLLVGGWLTRTLQQAATLALAIFGFLFCLLSSYSLPADVAKLSLTAAVFVLLFSALYSSKPRGILALAVFLLGLIWGWIHVNELLQGILLLVQQAIAPLSLNLPEAMAALLTAHDAAESLLLSTQAMQAILFLTTLLAGYFIFVRSSAVGLALVTLPLLLPAPFYLLSPGIAPFFCLVTALLMVYVLNGIRYSAESSLPFSVSSRRRNETASQLVLPHWLALSVLPLIGLVLLLSSLVLPEEGYERPEAIENLQQEIFSLQLGKDSFFRSNDGLTHGDLRDLTSIRFTGSPALKIRTTQEEAMYLRDFAGAAYSDEGWSIASTSDYASIQEQFLGVAPQNLSAAATTATGASSSSFSLDVKNIAASKTSIWVPNGLITTTNDIPNSVYLEDSALGFTKASAAKPYSLTALPIGSSLSNIPLDGGATDAASLKSAYQAAAGWAMGLPSASGSEAERVQSSARAYIDYVFSTYGTLPESTAQAASLLLSKYNLSLQTEDGSLSLYETCRALYLFLSEHCVYAYSPPQPPEGTDFSTYFLEQSRQGYCVHFATTAAVLLRALGIPTRYAEGYIVIPTDYEKQRDADGYISIEDTHAHAWVEIFDPVQLDWIPVEMTASTGSNPNDLGQGESDSSDASSTPESTPTAEPTPTTEPTPEPTTEPTTEPTSEPDASGEPTASPEGEGTPEPTDSAEAAASESPGATPSPAPGGSESPSPDGEQSESEGTEGEGSSSQPRLWPLLALALAGGLTAAFFGLRKAAVKRLKRLFFQRDANAAVLALCGHALRMLRFAGLAPLDPLQHPEDYVEAAVKALPWLDGAALLRLLELAQRARFSNKTCPRAGRDDAALFVRSLMRDLPGRLPRLRRWLFRLRFPAI